MPSNLRGLRVRFAASILLLAALVAGCGDDEPDSEGVVRQAERPAFPAGASSCRCAGDGDSEPPATAPERERPSFDDGLACDAAQRARHGLATSKSVALRASPRAATGPPIHLVLQVFTI